jgi:hypothetical protein
VYALLLRRQLYICPPPFGLVNDIRHDMSWIVNSKTLGWYRALPQISCRSSLVRQLTLRCVALSAV